jgi:hypothetical protein
VRIKLYLEPSDSRSVQVVDIKDLGITEEEWKDMSDYDKFQKISDNLNNVQEQPYWLLDKFQTYINE